MSEQYANVTVSHKVHSDRRFDLLAELGGWTRNDATFRMVQLWGRCTAMQTDRPPAVEIRIHLGLRGEDLLVAAGLGERCPDGAIRVLGGGLSGGDTDRFSWYEPVREQQREAGLKRAQTAARGPGGRFGASAGRSSAGPAPTSGSGVAGPAATSGSPAATSGPPASGFRTPEEDQSSLPRAIPVVGPKPDATPAPVAEPASPPAIPPGESAWHRRQRWWGAMLEADQRIRAAGIGANDPSLPKAPAGTHEQNLNRCERQLLDGGATPDEVDAKMRHIVDVAEAEALRERHRRWFKPAMIWDPERAARAVDTSLAEASRVRTPAATAQRSAPQPSMPAPPKFEREVERPRTPEELAADWAATQAALKSTTEIHKLYGDGQRAPPQSAFPDDDPPDRRRKAAK